MKIGLLDSGIGGLTILKALIEKHPNHEYIFYGDTLHVPYGSKKISEITNYANNIIKFLEKKGAEVIIIACGTLSSNIEKLQSKVPLIDIISPIAGKLDKYQNVSVLATEISIKINAFQKYVKNELNLIPCPLLVPLIESNDFSHLDSVLPEYLKHAQNSDAILLGCTHYPLIKEHIKKYFKGDIICLDNYIVEKIANLKPSSFKLTLYFSKLDDNITSNVKRILDREDVAIERSELND